MLLGEGAVSGGPLLGAGDLDGRGQAGEAVDRDAADLKRAGAAVEVNVDAGERHERLIAGRNEGELLDLGGEPEAGAEGGILEVERSDLVHHGAEGLGRRGEDLLLAGAEDQRGGGPGKGAAAMGGMGGSEVGVGLGKAPVLDGAAHGVLVLGLESGEVLGHRSSKKLKCRLFGER